MFRYIFLAIPIFFILIAMEAIASWIRKDHNYRFTDAITNLSLGLGQTVIDAVLKTILIIGYIAVYDHLAFFKLPDTLGTFCIMLITYDFIYYWFHRFSHRINFLWAVHVVHHSSEDFNFTVALRQAWLHKTVAFAFFAPFPFLGVSPLMFAYVNAFQTLYQFWLHTKYIGKLGPLEWIIVTPSHHRVHHSFSPEHIDKNYGGTFIIWDRLFGTFAEEKVAPVYGITSPVRSWNPIWANLHYWRDLFAMAYHTKSWRDKIQVFFSPPSWHPKDIHLNKNKINNPYEFQKYDTPTNTSLIWYVLIQFAVAFGISINLLSGAISFTMTERLWLTGLILWSLTQLGLLISHRQWAKVVEFARLGVLCGVLFYYTDADDLLIRVIGASATVLFMIWMYRIIVSQRTVLATAKA